MWVIRPYYWEGDFNLDWLRDWIMQIAGIIVLGTVCDMIINDGEMKKYVKMVMGLILIFAMIQPVTKVSSNLMEFKLPQTTQIQAAELKNRLGEKEQESLLKLYRQKLKKSVENEIYTKWKVNAVADVVVEENNENRFGDIRGLNVQFEGNCDVSEKVIKESLSERFGVSPKYIKVR